MTNPTEELNLCKACDTMKHLDADGYCGQCVAPSSEEENV